MAKNILEAIKKKSLTEKETDINKTQVNLKEIQCSPRQSFRM